jgi:hypothetical protein
MLVRKTMSKASPTRGTFGAILDQAGPTVEEFLALL